MNIIKNIKTWLTKKDETTTVNISADLQTSLEWYVLDNLRQEVCRIIAEKFFQEHEEKLKKTLLQDKNFADKVYNAVLLNLAANYSSKDISCQRHS